MRFLFCANPLLRISADEAYAAEVAAVDSLGVPSDLLDFESLVHDHASARATRRVPSAPAPQLAVYRGWMLRPEHYTQLYDALRDKNLFLINTPDQYRHCHYLPESYRVIESVTPRTIWLKHPEQTSIATIVQAIAVFGERPVIVKDYVKSRKHEWLEACYIPAANDRAAVERVVGTFLERQGDDLNEGLVFREFLPFEHLTNHSRSGMPLTLEYRLFVAGGAVVSTSAYWEEGAYHVNPPAGLFEDVIGQIGSNLFTIDIARRTDGTWMVIELGDGQVAGLPETLDVTAFYTRLVEQIGRLDVRVQTSGGQAYGT